MRASFSQSYRKRLGLDHLQRILTVYPEAFGLKWQQNQQGKHQLVIVVEPSNNLNLSENRKHAFKTQLLRLVDLHHTEFLRQGHLVHADPKIWHPAFRVHEVPDVDLAELPPKPDEPVVEPMAQFLESNTVKNQLLSQLMQKQAVDEQQSKKERIRRCLEEVTTPHRIPPSKAAIRREIRRAHPKL